MDTHVKDFLRLLQALQDIDSEFPLHYAICLSEISLNEGLSLTELSRKTSLALPTVSRIVSALSGTRKGGKSYRLVRARVSSEEKRRKEIFLTPKGREIISSISHIMAA